MEEIWKDIENWEGLYQVSNLGRLRSLDRMVWNKANQSHSLIKGCIKKPDTKDKSYAQIGLAKNGGFSKYLIHRLVAKAFIPNPNNLPEVNHKDLNKMNNHSDNLEWSTRLGNARHAKENGSYRGFPSGVRKENSKLNDEAVRHIRTKSMRNNEYCKLYGVKPSTITMIQKDKNRWKHVRV